MNLQTRLRKSVFTVVMLVFCASWAYGYEQPPVNLGFTSFLDGGPPAGPGWYLSEYIQYFKSDEFRDGPRADVDAWVSLTQLIYQSDNELVLGGKWGLDFILPYVDLDLEPDSLPIRDNDAGFGDLLIGPYLQWDPVKLGNGMVFMHRLELQFLLPTGQYDDNYALNPGSGYFSFNPYWSATLFLTPRWSSSLRFHYLWNDENDDPNIPGADTLQAGQAFHLNFASAYEVIPKKLRLGINGYYLKQFEDTDVDGEDMSDSRERILGIGPGAVLHVSKDLHLFLNFYWETLGENRPEGNRANLRLVYHF